MNAPFNNLPVIPHAGFLEECKELPAFLTGAEFTPNIPDKQDTWPFYVGGWTGEIQIETETIHSEAEFIPAGWYRLRCYYFGQLVERPALLSENGQLEVRTDGPIASPGVVVMAQLENEELIQNILMYPHQHQVHLENQHLVQSFSIYRTTAQISQRSIPERLEHSFVKFKVSMGEQRSIFPIQVSPSVLDVTGRRVPLFYGEAIERLADLLLAHRPPYGHTLIYASGELDYFAHFALQEVGRLLGVRNLTGYSEWNLRTEARATEMLSAQESPILTLEQALEGSNRFYLLNGWNGFITHLPIYDKLYQQPQLDAYLIDVMVSETAKTLAAKLGPERVLLIKPGTDQLLALAITHEILQNAPEALDQAYLDQFVESQTYTDFCDFASSASYHPEKIAKQIAADEEQVPRLLAGIRDIAQKFIHQVPILIPGEELSQSGGVAAHALWLNILVILGKWGFKSSNTLLGGVLRLPSQSNAQTQVQGFEPSRFFGNLPVDEPGVKEAALRMGLPENAYHLLLAQPIRSLLDYPEPSTDAEKELVIYFGHGLETQVIDQERWRAKLNQSQTTLVVVDPMPGPFLLKYAALCIPTPPEVATARLVQNGESRFTLVQPRRSAPTETRSETTLLYDVMAEISRGLREYPELGQAHPDLAQYFESGYLQSRFEPPDWGQGGGLSRIEGEVSRPGLWQRIQAYLTGTPDTPGPLYCRPESVEGNPLAWKDLLTKHSLISGEIGTTRANLTANAPFQDIYRNPCRLRLFLPTAADLDYPQGLILVVGSATLSDNKQSIRYAITSALSSQTQASSDLPQDKYLYISSDYAAHHQLQAGQKVKITQNQTRRSVVLRIMPSEKLKGQMAYLNYHPSLVELGRQSYFQTLASTHTLCPYSGSPRLLSPISIEIIEESVDVS